MRRRAAAVMVLLGIALVPTVAQAAAASSLHVTVAPLSGSTTTHFAVSFRVPGRVATPTANVDLYRITASGPKRAGCQASAVAAARATPGTTVRVHLSPARSRVWCTGSYRGQVWQRLSPPCPVREACPAILPLPVMVGKFAFRVTGTTSRNYVRPSRRLAARGGVLVRSRARGTLPHCVLPTNGEPSVWPRTYLRSAVGG